MFNAIRNEHAWCDVVIGVNSKGIPDDAVDLRRASIVADGIVDEGL